MTLVAIKGCNGQIERLSRVMLVRNTAENVFEHTASLLVFLSLLCH